MKVKVNGSWVDVPAFQVVEKGNGHGVIEGEITIVGNVKSLQIDYDELPNKPFFASLLCNESDKYVVGSGSTTIGCNYFSNGIQLIHHTIRNYTSSLLSNYTVLTDSPIDKTSVVFNSFANNQNFVLGTYTYKIAY